MSYYIKLFILVRTISNQVNHYTNINNNKYNKKN